MSILLATVPPPPQIRAMHVPVETKARELVANLTAGRFDAVTKDFNDDMLATATPRVLAEQKQILETEVGRFRGITSTRQYRQDGFRVVDVTCRYEKSPAVFHITFDTYDRIGAVRFTPVETPKVDPALEATAREFLTNFNAGNFEAASTRFDLTMQRQLTPAKLADLARTITTRHGPFRSVTQVSAAVDGAYRVIILATAHDVPVEVRLVFNPDGTIAGLRIGPMVAVPATPPASTPSRGR
ncbi:MAG TPA: DUF3887 domain-containing protein [Thermoanaerobaculia bacterium]|nr:DUF3887 domain-containing protein [Thermoanaerobaculia bacterium]